MHTDHNKIVFGGCTWESTDCLAIGDYGGSGTVGEANIRAVEEMARAYDPDEEERGKPFLAGEVVRLTHGEVRHIQERTAYRATGKRSRYYSGLMDDEIAHAVKHLRKRPLVVMAIGHHGYQQAYINTAWSDGNEALATLANYPLLDDEAHSEIEEEWTARDLESYGHGDILKAVDDGAWSIGKDDFFSAICAGLEKHIQRQAFRHAREVADNGGKQVTTFEDAATYFHADNLSEAYGEFIAEWIAADQALFLEMQAADLNRHQGLLPLEGQGVEWRPISEGDAALAEGTYYAMFADGHAPQGIDATLAEEWRAEQLEEAV